MAAAVVDAAAIGEESEDYVSKSIGMRSVRGLLAVAALCVVVSGCASDATTSTSGASKWPGDSPTLRYYGGPKSPMWPSQ
jgi:hypothetical protein